MYLFIIVLLYVYSKIVIYWYC